MEYTKFIYCETTSAFDSNKENGTITDSCIVFIKDSKQIWTHGQFFPCPYTKEQIDQMISDLESGNESSIESLREELTNFIETKGKANGIASLDKNGKVPSSQLPSYVDDVIDLKNIVAAKANIPTSGLTVGDLYFATAEKKIYKATSATAVDGGSNPESGKIYINLSNSKTYRWSGTSMAVISETLALGETSSTAYAGNKGKSTTDKVNSHVANTSNPHEVTLAQVGTITTTGSGNAVTSLSISGKTLTVTKGSTFNNYSLPLASSSTRGGIKIGYEGTGKNYAVKLDNEKAYVSVPWTDTNTHYTTRLYATTSSGTANASATNGNVYIRLFDDSTARSSLNIKGTGATTVTSNSSGVITINSTNTTYGVVDADSNGLMTPAMLVKLNGIEEDANNYVHPTSAGNKHIPSGGSEGQILRWSANGTAVWGNDNNTTYSNFKGATSSAAGSSGLVPAPSTGYQGRYLRGDGTWATPTNTTYSKATSSTFGLVKIGFPESGKNYPVELNSSGQMFVNVPWTDTNTTYSVFKAASSSAAGGTGLVPAPAAGENDEFLRGDGTWAVPTNTTYSVFKAATSSAAGGSGLVPAPKAGENDEYLRGDGTWATPTNTTYSKATSSTLGLVRIGFTESGKNYPVELNDNGQMFVNVPWTDNNTTYSQATSSKLGLVKIGFPESGKNYPVELNSSGQMFVNVPWTNTTYSVATTSANGLMSSAMVTKLNGIAEGANKYTLPTASSSTLGGVKIGTGINISSGVISVKYGTAAGTAAQGNDSRLSDRRNPKTTTLTNQDLNNYRGIDYVGFYNGGGSNTVTNKPSDVAHFGLIVMMSASGYTTQILASNNQLWYRTYSTSWGSWLRIYSTGNLKNATTSTSGLMTAAMVTKLNGIQTGADSVSFSRSLSSGTKIGTITINGTGTDLYCQTNTDTHYTTHLYATTSSGTADASATNGNVYLRLFDNTTARDSINIKGTGATTVTSNASGVITINSTNTNTTYTFANGSSGNFTVTPSGGSAQTVSIGKPATAGKADTATKLATKRTISLTGDVTGSASFDGSANASITASLSSRFDVMESRTISLSSQSKSNFYPVTFDADVRNLRILLYSRGASGSDPYNMNRIEALIHANGWDDSGHTLTLLDRFNYDDDEITIGSIGYGTESGPICIWLRGGLTYTCYSNIAPSTHTSNYTSGGSTYSVGTSITGGTNTKVGFLWRNDSSNRNNNVVAHLDSTVSKANTLATSRTINGTSFNGSANITTANWGTSRTLTIGNSGKSVNGSGNVTWSLSEIGAAASSHTHSYLPLSGGTLTTSSFYGLTIKRSTANGSAIQFSNSSGALAAVGVLSDKTFAVSSGTATDGGMFKVTSGGVAYAGETELAKINRTIYIGTTSMALNRSSASQTLNGVSVSGNAGTATRLQTARTINGTSFNGSANITTANWGTSRTLKIGNTSKSVNGSANVSWSLSEIGAAAASHSHSYLPLSGGTMTGVINTDGISGSWITGKTNAAIRFNNLAAINTTSSWYLFNMKSSSSHVLAFGGLGNNIGFYTFLSSRTDNGTDSSFTCDTSTGNWTCNKRITASGGFSGSLSGNASSATYVTRERGSNAVTTLTRLPISKATVTAKLSKATTISVASGLNVGESVTVICTPSANFTQPIPATGSYISMDGSSLSVKSGKIFEINIYCYASGKYSISLKTQK